jgi:hypothetical protein
MDKSKLLQVMEESRETLLSYLEQLDEKHLLTPGTINNWSVKDLLVHLTLWEAHLVTLLFQVRRGQKPNTIHFSNQSDDEINARWQVENQDRDLELVLDDFYGVRPQTIRRVREFSERDLFAVDRYPWAKGHALWEWIAGSSYEHEQEHLPDLQHYVSKVQTNSRHT